MNKTLRVSLLLIIGLMVVALVASPVSAQTVNWYVGPGGSDANDCLSEITACLTVNAAIGKALPGDTINVLAGTYPISAPSEAVLLNKEGITLLGAGAGNTVFEVTSGAGDAFVVSAVGVTLTGVEIYKTDKTGPQALIYVGADNFTLSNNLIHGNYVLGDPDVSRAMVVTYGIDNLTISGNTIHHLRQPGYLNGSLASPTTGSIANNLVYATRGWVIDGANMAFSGNSWSFNGEVNVYDVAILAATPASYYTDLPAVSAANADAVIEDQRANPALLSVVHVDDNASASGSNGGPSAPYPTISAAVPRVMPGGKILVAAGDYIEEVTLNKPGVRLSGAGHNETHIIGRKDTGGAATLTFAANNITVSNLAVTRDGNNAADWAGNVKTSGVVFNQGTTGNILRDCLVTGNRNGVYINNAQGNTITNNIIDFNRTGIQLANNVTNTLITQNQISNNWTLGILFNFDTASLYTTSISITNNAIFGNWYAGLESRWTNSRIANASGNWYGTGTPVRRGSNSTEPGYASLIPAAFGGTSVPPASAPDISGNTVQLIDYTPWQGSNVDLDPLATGYQGDFALLWADDNSPQSSTAGRIHEAVNMAAQGGTVWVLPGIYEEQVTITKPVNLIGFGIGRTFVHAPPATERTTLTRAFAFGNRTIDYIIGAFETDDVYISSMTIDGLKRGAPSCVSGVRAAGVALINSSGIVEEARILNTSQPQSAFGCQDGAWQGVLAASSAPNGPNEVTVRSVTVETFQKNGLTAWSDAPGKLFATIEDNFILTNPTGLTAQNGIQLSYGASGEVRRNYVSGVYYLGEYWTASGILIYNASNALVEENLVTLSQSSIVVQDGPAVINDNSVYAEQPVGVMNAYSGIMVVDPPGFVPSPFEELPLVGLTASRNQLSANGLPDVFVTNNVIQGGSDQGAFAGIEAYQGYGSIAVDIVASGNDITGWQNGFYLGACTSGCTSGTIHSFTAHHNRIVGNGAGATNETTIAANFENNWWGCNEGPGSPGCDPVSGDVDADPWLMLTLNANPSSLYSNQTVQLEASLNWNSDGQDTSSDGSLRDGYSIELDVDSGSIAAAAVETTLGEAATAWTLPGTLVSVPVLATAAFDNAVAELNRMLNPWRTVLPLVMR